MSRHHVLVRAKLKFHDPCPVLTFFEEANCEVAYLPGSAPWPEEETREQLAGMDGILAGGDYGNPFTLEKAERLKVIARSGVGYDRIDLDLCSERGIVVTNTPGAMADAVADEALALMLALIRRVFEGDRQVKDGAYAVTVAEDLAAMTLGLVGCGRIGAEVARRAAAFKMRILVYDPWVEAAAIEALGAAQVSLDELLAQADVISLHTPLSSDNEGMVNSDFLRRMKAGSYLLNTARGPLVDEVALIEALKNGPVAGAALDCQATEPPTGISLELVRLENVIAMPHAASNTITARERMALWAAQSIVDCLEGRVPEHVVNKEVLDRL